MKNLSTFFSLSIIIFFTVNVIGQSTTFGLRAGLNFATVNFEEDGISITPDNRIGITIAGLAEIGFTEAFSVQPELHFIQKGFKLSESNDDIKLKMNYLEIPILAKYKFNLAERIGGFILAGPTIGFALNGEGESCFNGDCESENIDFDEDGFNRADIGIGFGAGVSFSDFFFDIRYVLGLTNIADEDTLATTSTNRGLQLGLGYMFGGE